jgi:diaminopimelate epimerase
MKLSFDKYHGTGNDFVIVNFLKEKANILTKEQIIKICKRNFGIGADGILVVLPSSIADYKMRIFNSDASEPEMCGNGIRCFVKYLYDKKLVNSNDSISVETLAGVKESNFYVKNNKFFVEVNMGKPSFEASDLFKDVYINKKISNNEKFTSVSMGNPHMVILKDEKIDIDYLETRGSELVNNEYFLNGTNVEFITLKDKSEIDMMVYERGAGITLACGTGACASVSVLGKLGEIEFGSWVKVNLLGGTLEIMVKDNFEDVILKGEAESVFSGTIDI